jgi:hypothetical protein
MDDRERLTKSEFLKRSEEVTRLLADVAAAYHVATNEHATFGEIQYTKEYIQYAKDYIQSAMALALDQHLELAILIFKTFKREWTPALPKTVCIQVARSGDTLVQLDKRKPWIVASDYAGRMMELVMRTCELYRSLSIEKRKLAEELAAELAEENTDPTDEGCLFTEATPLLGNRKPNIAGQKGNC